MRHLTKYERNLVSMITDAQAGKAIGDFELENLLVESIDSNGCLKFLNDESGHHVKFPVEAYYMIDSASLLSIHALLFIKNNKLDELEIYRDDGESVGELPPIEQWTIVSL